MNFSNFVKSLTSIEAGQAIEAHEPTGEESISILNPNMQKQINFHLITELNEAIYSAEEGIQKIRKVLHLNGFDLPALYEPDREGDELVIEISQFGNENLSSNIYILYYLDDSGVFDFYAEVGDEGRMDELLSDGVE